MHHVEKKYRVATFAPVKSRLTQLGAVEIKTDASTHYYGQSRAPGVVKLVVYSDRSEIHTLDEQDGTFSLRERIPVNSKTAGLQWLKAHGYTQAGVVSMAYTDYAYKGGVVGLYTLNSDTYSVILDFPNGEHAIIEQELRLGSAEVIAAPYNKYLGALGRFEIIKL